MNLQIVKIKPENYIIITAIIYTFQALLTWNSSSSKKPQNALKINKNLFNIFRLKEKKSNVLVFFFLF